MGGAPLGWEVAANDIEEEIGRVDSGRAHDAERCLEVPGRMGVQRGQGVHQKGYPSS